MNKDIIKGNWKEVKGKLKQQWGKLIDAFIDHRFIMIFSSSC